MNPLRDPVAREEGKARPDPRELRTDESKRAAGIDRFGLPHPDSEPREAVMTGPEGTGSTIEGADRR